MIAMKVCYSQMFAIMIIYSRCLLSTPLPQGIVLIGLKGVQL